MNRLLILIPSVLSCFALSANAGIINVTTTRTAYDGTLDQVILRVQSITGTSPPVGGPNIYVTNLTGTWDFGTGAINLPGTSSNWAAKVLNDGDCQDSDGGIAGVGPTTPQTWFNFSTKTADPSSRSGLISGTLYHRFTEGLNITMDYLFFPSFGIGAVDATPGDNGSGNGFDNTLLAVLYVSKTTALSPGETIFSGTAAYNLMDEFGTTTVQIVPEPSTLALLCCGLLGLLAYMRRTRE
jgi:hypothetical protein